MATKVNTTLLQSQFPKLLIQVTKYWILIYHIICCL